MNETEWEGALVAGKPENLLDDLIEFGHPWNLLRSRLDEIDQQFKAVAKQYSRIHDAVQTLAGEVREIRRQQERMGDTVGDTLKEMTTSLQNRWLIGVGSIVGGASGLGLSAFSAEQAQSFIRGYGSFVGLAILAVCAIALFLISRQK